MDKNAVVVAYVQHQGKILLVRRSPLVRSFKQHWSIISGGIESHESDPLQAVLRELEEEVGLSSSQLSLVKTMLPFEAEMADKIRCIHPFLFESSTDVITLNWENTEYAWVAPADLSKFVLVEGVDKLLEKLLSL
ncbi:MAG: NUDIX domain-containing protein [Nanoarchaeota archaeon]|nr:NUDIX domain-containing protein [Nanoarchaeota archaeon]